MDLELFAVCGLFVDSLCSVYVLCICALYMSVLYVCLIELTNLYRLPLDEHGGRFLFCFCEKKSPSFLKRMDVHAK